MESHSHRSANALQLCKCALDTCEYCTNHPVCMPLEEFNSLCYLPLPLHDERDQPSFGNVKDVDEEEMDKANHKLASSTGRVRAAINCGECFKPRCVYAEATLSQKEKYMLCELESNYTCESTLFSPTSLYHSSIVTRANLTCHHCVDAQYYSSPLIKFKPVCSHCSGPKETIIEDEIVCTLKDRKQVVRPICFLC